MLGEILSGLASLWGGDRNRRDQNTLADRINRDAETFSNWGLQENNRAVSRLEDAGRFRPFSVSSSFGRSRLTIPGQGPTMATYPSQGVAEGGVPGSENGPNRFGPLSPFVTNGSRDPNSLVKYQEEAQLGIPAGALGSAEAGTTSDVDPRIAAILRNNATTGDFSAWQAMQRAVQTPEQLARQRFDDYQRMARPAQLQDFNNLLAGLAANGQLGASTAGAGGNPTIAGFSQGLARADMENYYRAIGEEQGITDRILGRSRDAIAGNSQIEDQLRTDRRESYGLSDLTQNRYLPQATQMFINNNDNAIRMRYGALTQSAPVYAQARQNWNDTLTSGAQGLFGSQGFQNSAGSVLSSLWG